MARAAMVRWKHIERDVETREIVSNLWHDTLAVDSSNELIHAPTITDNKFLHRAFPRLYEPSLGLENILQFVLKVRIKVNKFFFL